LWLEEEATGEFLIIGLSAALLGRSVAIWCSEVFVAYEKARLTFKLQSTFRLLEVFAGIALLYSGFGLVAIVALHVCSWWLEALAGLLVVRRTVAGFSLPRNLTGSAGFLRQGLPLTLLDLCSTWFMVGPVVMYRHLSNDSVALGELTFALQIFFMLVTVVASFSIAVLPLMSRLGAKQEGADFTLSFVSYKFGLLFAGMFIVTGSALAAPLTTLLLTEDYAATDTLIASALWLLVPIAAGAGLQQRLIAAGGDRQVLGANAAGALLMTLLFTFALKAFGVQGTILAAGSGLMLTLLLQVAIFVRRDGPAWITVSIKALGALLASYYLCVTLVPTNLWLASLLPPVALLMLYWLFVFDAEERNRFRAGLRNRNRAGGSNQ
jgi:O-antigen/teichoic acid export membrane protein